MPAMATAAPYRDPRTAYGRRIPVGEATELAGIPPEMQPPRAAAPAAAPAAGGIAEPPPQRAGTLARGGLRTLAGPVGIAAAAAPEALDVGRVLKNPAATGIDVATQAAEGVGRLAAAGAGAAGGAKLGAMAAPFLGPVAPLAPVVGGIAGGAYGYFAADQAIKGARQAVGVDPRSPVDQIPSAAAAPARRDAGAGRGFVNPPSIADMPASQPGPNTIIRDGNSYSGPKDITEGAEIRRPNMALRNGGQVSVVPGRGAEVQAIEDRARSIEAVNAGLRRELSGERTPGGTANLGPDTRRLEAQREMQNLETQASSITLSPKQRAQLLDQRERLMQAGIAGDNAQAIEASRGATQRGIAEIQGNTQRDVAAMAADSRMSAAETNANARAAAAELAARRFIPVAGGQQALEIGGLPTTVTQPSRVFDSSRGIYIDPPAPQGGGKPAVTPRAEYEKLPKGAKYVGPDGQTYVKG